MRNEDLHIEELARIFGKGPSKKTYKGVILGIGDDAAVIGKEKDTVFVITTDALCEGVHFLRQKITPKDLAWKSMAVSLSDVASMGATPHYALVTLSVPKGMSPRWIDKFTYGIKEITDKYGLTLLGGDTTASRESVFISSTIIGMAKKSNIKARHGAKTGDKICLLRPLGASRLGLMLLTEKGYPATSPHPAVRHHLSPRPMVEEGIFLGRRADVTAMMDISDGLNKDLGRLLKSSRRSGRVFLDKIPIDQSIKKYFKGKDAARAVSWALTSGEEYGLLLTVRPDGVEALRQAYRRQFGHDLFVVGEITSNTSSSPLKYYRKNREIRLNLVDFEHF